MAPIEEIDLTSHTRRVAQRTLKSLVEEYGFDPAKAAEAVETIGDKGDVSLAIGWLLDHGEEDRGGAISLKRCPHIDYHDESRPLIALSALRFGCECASCPPGEKHENWVCLHSGQTFCSRYRHKHSLQHWQETKEADEKALTVAEAAAGKEALGHHLAISASDLSVWCYECQAYVEHGRLEPLVQRFRELKFGSAEGSAAGSGTGLGPIAEDAAAPAAAVAVGDPMSATAHAMHGRLADAAWVAPRVSVACDAVARPGYRSCAAHEYEDTPEVLEAKVSLLAKMLTAACHPVAYTGAGISTASGIRDYATQGRRVGAAGLSPLEAPPSAAHRVLAQLHGVGRLSAWVQQNHDGLPQKAGIPQAALNEIHGSWFDPSNPVVPMDGTLRADLLEDLAATEQRADLCIVLGTSLCGMNADRVAATPARKARQGAPGALGTVIVNLQRTVMDEQCQLRIFAPIDKVLGMLAHALRLPPLAEPSPAAALPPGDVYEVPYDRHGRRTLGGTTTTLDLRPGATVRLVDQPQWDAERCGSLATVRGRTADGHWVLQLPTGGDRARRTLGSWWVAAALDGAVPRLPVVSYGDVAGGAAAA